MIRRFHKKTRTGCAQCKQRRVKCDERKPSCTLCERQGRKCSLEFLTPSASLFRSIARTKECPNILAPDLSLELSPSAFTPKFNELFHHYATALYAVSTDNCSADVWRVTIPQLGLQYPFLLRGLLAMSALHLASLVPQRRKELHTLALVQESLALPSFRQLLQNPKGNEVHAMLVFTISIGYSALASPDQAGRHRLPNRSNEHPHWFQTIRGSMLFLDNHWLQIAQGPLGPTINTQDNENHTLKNPDDNKLVALEEIFAWHNSLSTTDLTEENIRTFKGALEVLRQTAGLVHSSSLRGEMAVRVWPAMISQEFAELLYDSDPIALVILAYYCSLLKRFDHIWYLESLGVGLLESVRQALPDSWLPWIEWPEAQPASTIYVQ